ncbi:MAG: hypothetical protein KC468_28470, partial [Myxococcales bacterium]|nr:hypothetical protein [Myxococcales bacterium]
MSWRTHARVGLAGALWACTACAAGSTPALDATPVVASRPATVPAPALGFVETPPTRPGASS